MTKENDDALRCADALDDGANFYPESSVWYDWNLAEAAGDASDHLCRLVAENEALRRERDANLDTINVDNAIITRLKTEKESATSLVQQMLEALELGRDALSEMACAAEHIRRYKPKMVEAMNAEVHQADTAITAAREWLEGKK